MENVRPHYALLRIAPEATQAEIEEAYKRLVSYLGDKIAAGKQPPLEEFERLDAAFAVLRDPARRAAYDKTPHEAAPVAAVETPAAPTAAPPALPPVLAAQTADATANPRDLPFSFRGEGREYFRIWIVNLLLSIVTLGIYSAWAKVRREQYFHRNLMLDDAGFDYHGNPVAILKGRIVALLLFTAVSASQHVSLALYFGALAAGAFVFPWLIMRSMRFRAHNSSYRGLRFTFVGTYGGALKAYVGYGLIVLITFGFGTPMWLRETHKYILNNLRYGHGEFHCELLAAEIFGFIFKAWLIAIAVVFVATAASALPALMSPKLVIITTIISVLAPLLAYIALLPYLRMALNNYVWSRTSLDDNDFFSNMEFKSYLGITLKNWLFTLLTLGLYWPWAKVNLTRYRASCTGLAMAGSLDSFMASAAQQVGAFGDAATDVFDFDIAI